MPDLALSLDSLIASFGLSASLSRRHAALTALSFGVFDGLASRAAPLFPFSGMSSDTAAAVLLFIWAGITLSQLWWLRLAERPQWFAYAIPPLLCIDNLLFPANPLAAGGASFTCAALGLIAGRLVARHMPRFMPLPAVKGALLAMAGCGLLLA